MIIRLLDIFFALTLLIILSPLLGLIAMINKLSGENEILFYQSRVGMSGREFGIIKFATMLKDSERLGSMGFVEKNDFRLLPLGKFLRKTKLNELPQLLNVLQGDMSFVGFRPLVQSTYQKALALGADTAYATLPGITSLASIVFRDEEDTLATKINKQEYYDNEILPLKILLDRWWSDNISVKNYLLIMTFTALKIVHSENTLYKYFLAGIPSDIEP